MKIIRRLLVPNSVDCCLVVIALIAAASWLSQLLFTSSHSLNYSLEANLPILASVPCFIALGCCWGWGSKCWIRGGLMVLACLLGTYFLLATVSAALGPTNFSSNKLLRMLKQNYYSVLLIPTLFFATLFLRFGIKKIGNTLKQCGRKKTLIVVSVLLFGLAIGTNILKLVRPEWATPFALAAPIMLGIFAVYSLTLGAVCYLLSRPSNGLAKALVVMVVLAAVVAGMLLSSSPNPIKTKNWFQVSVWIVCPGIFLLTCLAMRSLPLGETEKKTAAHPSVGGLVLFFVVTLGGFQFTQYYDANVLLSSRPIPNRWQRSKLAASIKRNTSGAGYLQVTPRFDYLIFKCTQNTPNDAVSNFDFSQFTSVPRVSIIGLRPGIDTSQFAKWPNNINVSQSVFSRQQFIDLTESASSLSMFNCEFDFGNDTARRTAPATLKGISIYGRTARGSTAFVHLLKEFKHTISISQDHSQADWETLFDNHSGKTVVRDSATLPLKRIAESDNIKLELGSMPLQLDELDDRHFELLDAGIPLNVKLIDSSSMQVHRFWNLRFAYPQLFDGDFYSQVRLSTLGSKKTSFLKLAKRHHWLFDTDYPHDGILLPMPIGKFVVLPPDSISVMSLDETWINSANQGLIGVTNNFNFSVRNFVKETGQTKIKRLYLSPYQTDFRLSYLEGLTSLVHLQCNSPLPLNSKARKKQPKLSDFPTLESLTLFKIPTDATIAQLGGLKKLTKLTVYISDDASSQVKTLTEKLQSAAAKATVSVKTFSQFQPDLAPSFQRHLKSLKKAR